MTIVSLLSKGLKLIPSPSLPVWLVLGNESCDLDSAVSALVYSLLLSEEGHPSTFVLNLNRSDYELKTEVTHWFNKHQITKQHLIFRDELHLTSEEGGLGVYLSTPPGPASLSAAAGDSATDVQLTNQELPYSSALAHFQQMLGKDGASTAVKLCLVDHHVLAARDACLTPLVAEVLDHRPLDTHHLASDTAVTHALVGSCCTLVTEHVLQRRPHLLPTVASLLHGCIILDCVNCSAAAGRVTARDEAALTALEQCSALPLDRTATFQELLSAKCCVSLLTAAQLLRVDVKQLQQLRFCSLPVAVKSFLTRVDSASAVRTLCDRGDCSAVILLGMTLDAEHPVRDIAVYTSDEDQLHRLCTTLVTGQNGLLQLTEVNEGSNLQPNTRYFRQGNARASRKQIMPIIKQGLALE